MDRLQENQRLEYLDIIRRESEKLENMINEFPDFTRLQDGKYPLTFSSTFLDEILLELSEVYGKQASQQGIKLELAMPESTPPIAADPNAIRRVFANLLDNALKFSKEGGTIRVESEALDDHVQVRVQDDGMGIYPDDLPYIFDVYHRGGGSKDSVGHGVGLAAVKAIVEGHGGKVTVESEQGKGTVFKVILPVCTRQDRK
jgi:two-component system phosphate regulon sensor histidine kinase PhoR